MLTTGSKYLFGSAAFALIGAFFLALATAGRQIGMSSLTGAATLGYKGPVGNHFGYAVLVGYAAVALMIAVILSITRDGDPLRSAQVQGLDTAAPVLPVRGTNHWPLIGALGTAMVILGLVESPPVFIFGCILIGVAALQWTIHAWSDRATADPLANRRARHTMSYPLDFPLFAILAVFLFVFAVSRILLSLPKNVDTAVFGGVPAVAFIIAIVLNFRPKMSRKLISGLAVLGAASLLVMGVVGLADGPKEVEKHEHSTHLYDLKTPSYGVPISDPGAGEETP